MFNNRSTFSVKTTMSSDIRNPLHITFSDSTIQRNTLTDQNILMYFCNTANPFYDRTSSNQYLIMQGIKDPTSMETCLKAVNGIQYILWYSLPPLFVILKFKRTCINKISPLAYFYIINGVIHQAPDMQSVIQSRFLESIAPLRNAFDDLCKCSRFNTAQGYFWELKNKSNKHFKKVVKTEEKQEPVEQRSTYFQKKRISMIIDQLFEQMPVDDALARETSDEKKQE